MRKTNRNNHSAITTPERSAPIMPPTMPLDSTALDLNALPHFNWLQIMMEGHMDGMMLLTKEGQWLMANQAVRVMCDRLTPHSGTMHKLPKAIRRCCQQLIDSKEIYPNNVLILDAEISTDDGFTVRVRVQWFRSQNMKNNLSHHEDHEPQYILVILEDQERSSLNRALSEARQFGLSPREQEVWILRRTNHAMQDIADILMISLNTVKKHLKSIHFKQRTATLLNS